MTHVDVMTHEKKKKKLRRQWNHSLHR